MKMTWKNQVGVWPIGMYLWREVGLQRKFAEGACPTCGAALWVWTPQMISRTFRPGGRMEMVSVLIADIALYKFQRLPSYLRKAILLPAL